MYGVSFKRIDNSPYSTTVSNITATEILQKIWKPVQVIFLSIFYLFFVHPSITYLNKKKKRLVFELFYFSIFHLLNNGAMNPWLDMLSSWRNRHLISTYFLRFVVTFLDYIYPKFYKSVKRFP